MYFTLPVLDSWGRLSVCCRLRFPQPPWLFSRIYYEGFFVSRSRLRWDTSLDNAVRGNSVCVLGNRVPFPLTNIRSDTSRHSRAGMRSSVFTSRLESSGSPGASGHTEDILHGNQRRLSRQTMWYPTTRLQRICVELTNARTHTHTHTHTV